MSKIFTTFALDLVMRRIGYILLFLLSLGIRLLSPEITPVVRSNASPDCTVQQTSQCAMLGIQGEPLTITGSAHTNISAPTHFSYSAQRVQWSKNRTRTAFLRKMIQHYQPVFLSFRGKERFESSPFATPVCRTYYVYGLRRILC